MGKTVTFPPPQGFGGGAAKKIKLPDGTKLPIGAVAEGEFLKRSGGLIIGGTPAATLEILQVQIFT